MNALHISCERGHIEVTAILIVKHKADVTCEDGEGLILPPHISRIPLHTSHHTLTPTLTSLSPPPSPPPSPLHHPTLPHPHPHPPPTLTSTLTTPLVGETPLHCTVLEPFDTLSSGTKDDYAVLVTLLLKYGANVNARNGRGETAMHLAARHEFNKVIGGTLSYLYLLTDHYVH